MKSPRICVKCGETIGRQKRWHERKKAPRNGSSWCAGPCTTPLAASRRSARLPIHYRFYGDYSGAVVCGLVPGRTAGKYKKADAQVTWARVNVKLAETTCEECLAVLVTYLDGKLDERLALTGGTRAAALERAECRQAMRKLDQLVNGAAA